MCQNCEEFAGFEIELFLGDFYIAKEFCTVGSVSGDLTDQMLGHAGGEHHGDCAPSHSMRCDEIAETEMRLSGSILVNHAWLAVAVSP